MAKATHFFHSANNRIPCPLHHHPSKAKSTFRFIKAASSPSRKDNQLPPPLIRRKDSRGARRLLRIPTTGGRWPGEWSTEYVFTLRDLQLEDLAEDGNNGTEVFITLCLQKHTGFGLSVGGRITTSIARKCSGCSALYCSKIASNFSVWVLPSCREDRSSQIPEIGGDDPSVIYVKPGDEADLDSFVQDAIRLRISIQETCSDTCEKSEPKLLYIGTPATASLDKRWSRLLELRKSHPSTENT